MLLVIAPNLAIDRILQLPKLSLFEVQRTRSVRTQPGGKGSNAARVFRQLGGEVTLLGCVGRRNSAAISGPLQAMGIQVETIEAFDGESRVCTVILEQESKQHPTVINEESPTVDAGTMEALEARFNDLLNKARCVLVSGSLPSGVSADFYARVIRKASGRGVLTAIDATGQVLDYGLKANPALVKTNVAEMSTVVGPLGEDIPAIAKAIRQQRLPSQTIVTLGEKGSILVCDGIAWHATPPRVSHVNPIGTGDAFAAGYLKALLDGRPPEAALRLATAVAASDASTPEPGVIIPAEIPELLAATSTIQLR